MHLFNKKVTGRYLLISVLFHVIIHALESIVSCQYRINLCFKCMHNFSFELISKVVFLKHSPKFDVSLAVIPNNSKSMYHILAMHIYVYNISSFHIGSRLCMHEVKGYRVYDMRNGRSSYTLTLCYFTLTKNKTTWTCLQGPYVLVVNIKSSSSLVVNHQPCVLNSHTALRKISYHKNINSKVWYITFALGRSFIKTYISLSFW